MGSNPVETSSIFHVSVRDNNYCSNCPDKCQDGFSFSSKDFSAGNCKKKEGVVHRGSPWTGSKKGCMDRVHGGGPWTWGPCFVYVLFIS